MNLHALAKQYCQWASGQTAFKAFDPIAFARALSSIRFKGSAADIRPLKRLCNQITLKTQTPLQQQLTNSAFRQFVCFCAFSDALVLAYQHKKRLKVVQLDPEQLKARFHLIDTSGSSDPISISPVSDWLDLLGGVSSETALTQPRDFDESQAANATNAAVQDPDHAVRGDGTDIYATDSNTANDLDSVMGLNSAKGFESATASAPQSVERNDQLNPADSSISRISNEAPDDSCID